MKHANNFICIAIIGEKKWRELMVSLMQPFTSAEGKYFDLAECGEALAWIGL